MRPLTPDHGAPVRLVVPNWYGCACIKWVTHVEMVPDDEPATTQMREFAARTHQNGVPARARDYQPPIDRAGGDAGPRGEMERSTAVCSIE